MKPAVAPVAPGSLGADVAPEDLLAFLDALGRWRDARRAELDTLDEASLKSPERDRLTSDVLLSMTLWKAVADRYDLLLTTWDSGRVGEVERRRLTTLIWSRLDSTATDGTALAVALPEACRLSDALASSLRSRLRLEGSEADVAARVASLRATVERIRDQVQLIPAAHRGSAGEALDALGARVDDVADKALRGGDIGGFLPALEQAAATTERDLIVAASARDQARSRHAQIVARRDELAARGAAVRSLAAKALTEIVPAPRLGVPDVAALGEVPTESTSLADYAARLERVDQALSQAHAAFARSLEQRDDLLARLGGIAQTSGDLAWLGQQASTLAGGKPVDVRRLGALISAMEAYQRALETEGSRS